MRLESHCRYQRATSFCIQFHASAICTFNSERVGAHPSRARARSAAPTSTGGSRHLDTNKFSGHTLRDVDHVHD
jgi:hypothetical protein